MSSYNMVYIGKRDYYVPRSAKEVRKLLREYWTENEIPLPNGFSSMKSAQLYAIYHKIRKGSNGTSRQTMKRANKKEPKKPRQTESGLEREVKPAQLPLFR